MTTTVRHFTASAIVFDDHDRVLLVHHNKLGRWLYPGGHIDPNEDPAQAAVREVAEETGVQADVVTEPLFDHPAVTAHSTPWAILEMDVTDSKIGPHRHIDHVYVLRATSHTLIAQLDEVSGASWVSIAELADRDVPAELPALIEAAYRWMRDRTATQSTSSR